jgi:hypothetical protein
VLAAENNFKFLHQDAASGTKDLELFSEKGMVRIVLKNFQCEQCVVCVLISGHISFFAACFNHACDVG